MDLEIPYEDFSRYMEERSDTYSVRYDGDSISIVFEGSSPTVVDKLGEPVTVTIEADREGGMVRFRKMKVEIGQEVYEGSASSLES